MSNITQVVNVDKNLTFLKKSVIAAGLDKTLSETGPFTIFAPSDKAFSKLERSRLDEMLKPENKATLTALLNDHVIAGKIVYKDLKDGDTLTAMSGRNLKVHVKFGEIHIDDVKVQGRDVLASNGVVYAVESVISKN